MSMDDMKVDYSSETVSRMRGRVRFLLLVGEWVDIIEKERIAYIVLLFCRVVEAAWHSGQ